MRWQFWIGLVLLSAMWTASGQPAAFPITAGSTTGTLASSITGASAPLPDTAQSTVTTLTLSSSSVASGTAVTLTATVTANGSPVSPGTVTFCDATAKYCEDPAVRGTAQLTSKGTASIKLILGIGAHSIKVIFAGTNSDAASSSTAQTVTVTGTHPTTTTLASSGSIGNYTLTATVTGSGDTVKSPTGDVSFLDTSNDNAMLGKGALGASTLAQTFAAPLTAFAPGAYSVAVGDFNRDGKPDLVVAGPAGVDVSLGNGDGTFQSQLAYIAFNPISIAVGDFNGDGKLDLAVANSVANNLTVLIGNGDGSFQSQATYATGALPESVAVGDLNGDGKLDLVVANTGSNTLSVLLGNGDGTFQSQVIDVGEARPEGVAVGDFNGDGKLDLAVANSVANNLGVLLGKGDGTFESPVTYATGTQPWSVAVGDFNGDGKLDLAVTDSLGSSLSVLLGNGDGSFQDQVAYATGTFPQSVAVGDFNGDGDLDLAVANLDSNYVSVLLGNGDGTFRKQVIYAAGPVPQSVAVGDFNGDGKPDLAVANGVNVGVLLDQVTQTASATLSNFSVPGIGTHNVDASYPGDANYSPSVSNTVPLTASTSVTLILSSDLLGFNPEPVGMTSPPGILELTNKGSLPVPLGAVTASGDFSVPVTPRTTCSSSVASGSSCYMYVVFKPTATGLRTGNLVINESIPGSTQTVKLEGTGIGALVSPAALAWGIVQVGTASAPKQVTLSNVGGASMSLSAPTITNASGGDIWNVVPSSTNGCGSSLAANTSCSYTVTFTPNGVDVRHAELHINENLGSQLVTLTGTGTLVKISTAELSFGDVTIGNKSSKIFTITNVSSSLTLNFTAPQVLAGPDTSDFSISGCTGSLAPQTSCTETATFTPSVTGDRDALAWIYDNGGPSPQYVYLVGVGVKGNAPAYPLIVSANPPSGGTVSPTSSLYYAPGTFVAVTATPNADYFFAGWTGPGAPALADPSSAMTFIHMDAPESVTANFQIIPRYVVTVTTDDAGIAANCNDQNQPGAIPNANCSLRDALTASAATANGGNITFDKTVFTTAQTITLANGTLNIPSNTTITGPTTGGGTMLANLVTVNGNGAPSVFALGQAVINTVITGLNITGGFFNPVTVGDFGEGGGIANFGTLTVTHSTIIGNTVLNGFSGGGGIANFGTLTVTDSTISGNGVLNGLGEGIYSDPCLGGGGIYNSGTLTVTNSTLTGNSVGGCFEGGGGILNDGTGTLTMTNSTVSGNLAGDEPDCGHQCLIMNNGAGILNNGTLTATNNIVAANTTNNYPSPIVEDDCFGSCPTNGVNGNVVTANPLLDALGNYGGPTQTMLPQLGSPAICAGSISNIPSGVTTDQRGLPRTTNHNGKNCVDAGAVQTSY